MDISKILQNLKGKVLDATHFDLLKHAYELQEENIKQLRTNNDALKESHKLMAAKMATLESEHTNLEAEISVIQKALPEPKEIELSEYAEEVLRVFRSVDSTQLMDIVIVGKSGLNNIQAESGIAELQEANYMFRGYKRVGGTLFKLNSSGKQRIAHDKEL